MSRLPRFEEFRWIGTKDTMRVYDCDDPAQFDQLKARVEGEDLLRRLQLLAFAPDTVEEAVNRSFKPWSPTTKEWGKVPTAER